MADEQLERIYTIPLRDVKDSPRNHRADRAVTAVRKFLSRHMKAEEVWIDTSVNERLWDRGMYRIPSKIRVRARLFDDGVCEVSLPELEAATGGIRKSLADAKEKKLDEVHKTAAEAEERADAAGAAPATGVTKPKAPESGVPAVEAPKEEPLAKPEKPAASTSAAAKAEAPHKASKPAPKKEPTEKKAAPDPKKKR